MKRIIAGRRYDTETAKRVCIYQTSDLSSADFNYERTSLNLTLNGAWFLAGSGGATSRWAVRHGTNSWKSGAGIIPLSAEYAREFLEEHGTSEDLELYFASEIEDA